MHNNSKSIKLLVLMVRQLIVLHGDAGCEYLTLTIMLIFMIFKYWLDALIGRKTVIDI